MITEQGRVVAVDDDGLWVETANQSACSRCVARKGCGQSLLVQVDGHRSYIKAAFRDYQSSDFKVNDRVTIGVHESAVTRGSLLVYCVPLLGLIGGAGAGEFFQLGEAGVGVTAVFGLAAAAASVRWLSSRYQDDERYHPIVLGFADGQTAVAGEPGEGEVAPVQLMDHSSR